MKIGIIGAGNVGGSLGQVWAAREHEILYGVRDPASPKHQELLKLTGHGARAGSPQEAASFGEVVVLATPWEAAEPTVRSLGNLKGSILIDCTNPVAPGLTGLSLGHTTSAAEEVARWVPAARVVKAFNTTGANNMIDPKFGGQSASMFICGDDGAAKSVVGRLAEDAGFELIDAGSLVNARLLEPMAMLWIYLAYKGGLGRDFAFKLLRR